MSNVLALRISILTQNFWAPYIMKIFISFENGTFYEIKWTCYFIMLRFAAQITGYSNLEVNQRLFRFN